jgi:hypothetical protein
MSKERKKGFIYDPNFEKKNLLGCKPNKVNKAISNASKRRAEIR